MKVLLIDIDKCNGCYNCQIACKDEHVANDWSPIAKPQPDTGQFWHKVTDIVQGSVPKVRVRYMHDTCQQCDEAPCITACRSAAIYKRDDGIVIIDPEKCAGNRSCLDACPYNVIYFNTDLNISQKCTMCAHLLDEGWTEPRCVDACPTGALKFGEEEELKDLLASAETLPSDTPAKPRVYYLNLPNKYFIAGAVFDPMADEVLEGVTVSLISLESKRTITLQTDFFGDFWFEKQEPGRYSLKIEKTGYVAATLEPIEASKDLNVGDIALQPQGETHV
ncbi:MAG: carboxypeptidase regulatory-like domain-containing protein [Actinobacteria bacterium]|nr:carboxypeptidase regulatory-like domain-containing protein [Actinomycetota bacterium]